MKVKLIADKITIRGPGIDNGYKITLECGEYMKDQISELIKMLGENNYSVEIKEEK